MPSAAWRNADARYRERERRKLRAVESGGLYNELSTSPEWDGFFGALNDQQDLAQAAGMNYRVDLGSIGRPGYEGMDPGGRPNNKFLAQTLASEDISRRLQAANAERDEYNRQRQQQILNDLNTDYINQVQAGYDAPPMAPHEITKQVSPGASDKYTIREAAMTPDERVLSRLPTEQLRAQYRQQMEKAALEREKLAAASQRDDSPLVAIMGPNGQSILVPRQMAVGQRPASSREQGRPVTSGDAGRVADYDTSLDDLKTLRETLTQTAGATGTSAKIGASMPNFVTDVTGLGTEAKQRQAVIDRVKQVIGKALEGGVLRKEDEYKYEKILPTIGDPQSVAASKLDGLEQAIIKRRQTQLDALEDAGYEVGQYRARAPHGKASGAAKDPLGIR